MTIHEMGHGVGLRHRETERVLINGDTYTHIFDPDETDYYNLLVFYGKPTLASPNRPQTLSAWASGTCATLTAAGITGIASSASGCIRFFRARAASI